MEPAGAEPARSERRQVIDVSLPDEDISVLFGDLIGKRLFCETARGKTFIARLVAIRGGYLRFVTNDGGTAVNKISDIARACELTDDDDRGRS